ncbi:MAG: P-II family nitrogen regulator [Dethiobacteria bacterium]|jgi:nitrogen regulatory protein P-II 1
MFLLVLVLNRRECLNKILEKYLEIGIKGATILDSKGMGRAFMEGDSPVVGGLRNLIYNQSRPGNNTVFSVVESKEKIDEAIREIESVIGSLGEPGTGIVFTLPLERVKGLTGPYS